MIFTIGDSFTYGQGFDGTNETHDEHHPDAWPTHLGKLLNVSEVHNESIPGLSNKLIWHMAMNYDYHPDDIVVICWTCNTRWSTICDAPNVKFTAGARHQIELGHPGKYKQYGVWMHDDPAVMNFYLDHWNPLDMYLELCSHMDQINRYLQDKLGHRVFFISIPHIMEYVPITSNPPDRWKHIDWNQYYDDFVNGNVDIIDPNDPDPVVTDPTLKSNLELGIYDVGRYGKPSWLSAHILTSMDHESTVYGSTHDGHMHQSGHPPFASRLFNLMLKESPELLD